MPELPAVEFTRRLIEDHCINARIEWTDFFGEPDELIFSELASEFVKNDLKGRRVGRVGRWGKQLWLVLQPTVLVPSASYMVPVLLIHLGMTGFVQFKGIDRLLYESSPSNSKKGKDTGNAGEAAWPPKFVKFIFGFDNGALMAFCDARRFGKVNYLSIPVESATDEFIRRKLCLGFDPLISMPKFEEFNALIVKMMKRRINMKTLLMEQTFVAGIGNWMADDILLLAGIKPSRTISSLTEPEIQKFHKAIQEITSIAVAADANKSKFPKEWLFHIRWQHGIETLTGLKVLKEKIGGRTTFWVPELQK